MRRTPAIVNSARILTLALAPFCVLGCPKKKPKTPKPAPTPSPKASPDIYSGALTGSTNVLYYRGGKKFLEVTLKSGDFQNRADRSVLATVTGQKAVAYENGKPTLELTGDLAADTKAQTVTVKNGATIRWNRLSKTLAGENNVRFESTGVQLNGRAFTADDTLTQIHLMKSNRSPLYRAAVVATAGIAASSAFSQNAAGQKIGEFTPYVVNGDLDFRSRKNGTFDATLIGSPGSPISIRSAFLEITARKIVAQGTMKPAHATVANAVGEVFVKRVEGNRTVVLRAERAEYRPGDSANAGRVDLFGKTIWKTFDKTSPSEVTAFEGADGAILDFDAEGYRVRMKGSGVIPVSEKPKKDKK
jgi:hypothetical protein